MNKNEKYKGIFKFFWAASFFMGIGIYLATVVAVSVYIGIKFDEKFGTEPKGILTGITAGFPIAIYSVYRKFKEW